MRQALLTSAKLIYAALRPLIFRQSAQTAHERVMKLLTWADAQNWASHLAQGIQHTTMCANPIEIGRTTLEHRFILAAGFVKGHGFASEQEALSAVDANVNIMPGWKTMPCLVGLVEFGSFTRQPRMGNAGTVMWRDVATQSTQNRVGLKNPGVKAAARFLKRHQAELPQQFGVNIAISPGLNDPEQETQELVESIKAFLDVGVIPTWFTLNLSCPNTEDDPSGNQTDAKTRALCRAALQALNQTGQQIPLWVKIGPDLAHEQYCLLMQIFAELGVSAVVATNTLGKPTPDATEQTAGVGGGRLYSQALQATQILQTEKIRCDYPVAVIGCGGVLDGASYRGYRTHGVDIVQYWSALIYRGPLAAAIIESEAT